jgi:hypothetical protein
MTVNHTITFTFKTDRPITEDELGTMIDRMTLEIEEPQVLNTDEASLDYYVDADFTTTDIGVQHAAR